LKAAVTFQDDGRQVRMTIRLKDMFFHKASAMFSFPKFPRLRNPAEWASSKSMFGNKEEMAAGFFSTYRRRMFSFVTPPADLLLLYVRTRKQTSL
jgi:hypothetical protein